MTAVTVGSVELFAGPGGWAEGARLAGYPGELVGIDHDLSACRTATAAGHPRIQADVVDLDPVRFIARSLGWTQVVGLIASPPCQAWSPAGKRNGERDRPLCHALVDAYAAGLRLPAGTEWVDPRSPLVAEPVRWVRALRPRWVALEQVPPVLPLWGHIAVYLRRWGYRVWWGILAAEAYGVPQTRRRAILMASLDGPAGPPAPTHQEYRTGRTQQTEPDLFGDPLPPPVSMAEALGWVDIDRPARTVAGNRAPRWAYDQGNSYATGWTLANGRQANATERGADDNKPSPIAVHEAAILQGFRPDYPWRGTKTQQYRQVGDAVPPPLAAAILRPLIQATDEDAARPADDIYTEEG